jgi:hypothetical protein
MNTKGKGTGTIRANRMDELTKDWPLCEHKCPVHGIWMHKAVPSDYCHIPMFHECGPCIEYPNMYGKPLLRTTIRKKEKQ